MVSIFINDVVRFCAPLGKFADVTKMSGAVGVPEGKDTIQKGLAGLRSGQT